MMAPLAVVTPDGVRARRDDRGSLVLATLLIVVASMLAALLVPTLVTQVRGSQDDVRRDHSLEAARAGVQYMIGRIRDANDGKGNGVTTTLPCTTQSTPYVALVASGGNQRYETWVYYFARDPRGHEDWLSYSSTNTNLIKCTNSGGTALVPSYAVIVSTGTDDPSGSFASGTRTLEATYTVQTRDPNIPGGLIRNSGSSQNLCLDAGSSSPTPGTIVTLQTCDSSSASQLWAYGSNLTIQLPSSADPANGVPGLCLNAASAHSSNEPVTVDVCGSSTDEQWSYTGNRNFVATKAGPTVDSYCIGAQNLNTVGSSVVLTSCGQNAPTMFLPDTNVGAGNAGAAQKFIVNFNQFGRCLDVTHGVLSSTASGYTPFLISYPCKVSPDTTNAPTNQQWNIPSIPAGAQSGSGQITSVMDPSYCLVSPLTSGGYPYMTPCSGVTNTAAKTWTVWGNTGNYATSFRVLDSAPTPGCLQPTDPNATNPDLYENTPKVVVASCSSSTLQKWNAPPGILSPSLADYHEK